MQISTCRSNNGESLDECRVEKSHRICVLDSLFEDFPKSLYNTISGCLFSGMIYDFKSDKPVLSVHEF